MDTVDVPAVPRVLRRIVLLGLGGLSALCLAAVYYFIFMDRQVELAIAAVGAAQACLTAVVLVALVSFTLRAKSADDIQSIVDTFFIHHLCPAMERVDEASETFEDFRSRGARFFRRRSVKGRAKVSTDFARGRDSATFVLSTSRREELTMYVKINVGHVNVKYFFEPGRFAPDRDDEEFSKVFGQTVAGAKAVGYETEIFRRFHAALNRPVLELSCYCDFGLDLLSDPRRQLFLRNDLRTMTASVLHTLRSHDLDTGGDSRADVTASPR